MLSDGGGLPAAVARPVDAAGAEHGGARAACDPQQFRLARPSPAARRAGRAAGHLSRRLGLPNSDEPIHVYLFESGERFKHFMQDLPIPIFPTAGRFSSKPTRNCRCTPSGATGWPRTLRHEVTHAYVHSAVPDLPLWLDEGLAKFYEAPAREQGINRQLLNQLRERLSRALAARFEAAGATRSEQRYVLRRLRRIVGVGAFPAGIAAGIREVAAGILAELRHGVARHFSERLAHCCPTSTRLWNICRMSSMKIGKLDRLGKGIDASFPCSAWERGGFQFAVQCLSGCVPTRSVGTRVNGSR